MPERKIDLSVEVHGTVEEVWDTIATGPGITSWFIPHEIDEHEGGKVVMDFGSDFGKHTATVTVWDPPHRVVFTSIDEGPLAYEWLVEARDGGTCIVRLVNSGFGEGGEWDNEFAGMSEGWPMFLENLRLQLTHFRGQRARAIIPTVMTTGSKDAAFERMCTALGVRTDLEAGERFETAAPDAPPMAGTVATVIRRPGNTAYHLLLDAPVPGTAFVTAEGMGDQVGCSTYLYLYGPDAQDLEDVWSPWLTRTLGDGSGSAPSSG